MATKMTFNGLPAYQEGCFALVKNEEDLMWNVYHIDSGMKAMWIVPQFKQKRDAMVYVKELMETSINWSVKTAQELVERNGFDMVYSVISEIYRKVN